MQLNTIIQGNCLDVLKTLPDSSVNCIVTSPPYWGLRDYGTSEQIGLEATPAEYVATMVAVFEEAKRVLKDDGTMWLNLGDSYASVKSRYSSSKQSISKKGRGEPVAQNKPDLYKNSGGLKDKDLVGIPWRVAFALQENGWWLRQDIIWHKPNPMPESMKDRCTKAHEYIFLLAKSGQYYYDYEAILEPANYDGRQATFFAGSKKYKDGKGMTSSAQSLAKKGRNRWSNKLKGTEYGGDGSKLRGHSGYFDSEGNLMTHSIDGLPARNKRSVWTVPTKSFKEAHFATFPEELIKPCILAGCPEGGVVLDLFMGAGTTAVVARKLNRNYIGIELNTEYIKIANKRVQDELGLFI